MLMYEAIVMSYFWTQNSINLEKNNLFDPLYITYNMLHVVFI